MFIRMRIFKQELSKKELDAELNNSLSRVLCIKLEIEHMTGKKINES